MIVAEAVRTTSDALAPVRQALLRHATRSAQEVLAAADQAVDRALAEAREAAETIRAQARAQGEADAAAVLTTERARTRRLARATVLAAQGAAFRELRQAARIAVADLRSDPAYPALLERLREQARADLGPSATLTEHPQGGIVAEAAGRRSAYLLTDLADRALAGLGTRLDGLWTR